MGDLSGSEFGDDFTDSLSRHLPPPHNKKGGREVSGGGFLLGKGETLLQRAGTSPKSRVLFRMCRQPEQLCHYGPVCHRSVSG